MVVWLDRLDVLSVFFSLRFPKTSVIRYLAETPRGLSLALALRQLRLLRASVEPVAWSLGSLKDDDGRSLRFRVEAVCERVVDAAAQGIDEILMNLPVASLASLPATWMGKFYRSELFLTLRPQIAAFLAVQALIRLKPDCAGGILLLRGFPFTNRIRCVCRPDAVAPVLYGSWLWGRLLPFLRLIALTLRVFSRAAIRGLSRKVRWQEKACVAVQYCWGIDTESRNDLYWHDSGWLDPGRVLIYFDRSDASLTRALIEELDQQGYRWIVRHKAGCQVPGVPVWGRTRLAALREASWVWRVLTSSGRWGQHVDSPWWARLRMVSMLTQLNYWADFFESNHVIAHTNHSGMVGELHSAQSLALHLAGGCNFRTTYSYYSVGDRRECGDYHVFFAWGRCAGISTHVLPYHRRARNVVVSGYPFDGYAHRVDIPEHLGSSDRAFVVLAFDESPAQLGEYASSAWRGFFADLSSWSARRGDVVVCFKPKSHSKAELVEEVPTLSAAIATGSAVVLDRNINVHQVAGLADLVVGMGVSTASIECALLGKPALHYDPCLRPWPQLDGLSVDLVFGDFNDLVREMNSTIEKGRLVGNHDGILEQIDPFRDGRARYRIGEYLRVFVQGIDDGLGRDLALDMANREHTKRWGSDTILRDSAHSSFAGSASSVPTFL